MTCPSTTKHRSRFRLSQYRPVSIRSYRLKNSKRSFSAMRTFTASSMLLPAGTASSISSGPSGLPGCLKHRLTRNCRVVLLVRASRPSSMRPLSAMSNFRNRPGRRILGQMALGTKSADTIYTMRKPWVYKRRNIKGWWVGWYEGGKRKAKASPSKSLAEHFRHIKYTQLNADVFTSIVDCDWQPIVEEYRRFKQVEGLQEASIDEAMLTLGHFTRLAGPNSSRAVTQNVLDQFVLDRGQEIQKNILNKDIRNLNALLNWATRSRFVASGSEVKKVKMAQKPVAALSPQQVKGLVARLPKRQESKRDCSRTNPARNSQTTCTRTRTRSYFRRSARCPQRTGYEWHRSCSSRQGDPILVRLDQLSAGKLLTPPRW